LAFSGSMNWLLTQPSTSVLPTTSTRFQRSPASSNTSSVPFFSAGATAGNSAPAPARMLRLLAVTR